MDGAVCHVQPGCGCDVPRVLFVGRVTLSSFQVERRTEVRTVGEEEEGHVSQLCQIIHSIKWI